MKKRKHMLIIGSLFAVALVWLWWGHAPTISAQKGDEFGSKGERVDLVAETITSTTTKPPVDAAAPVEFETASFGLG